MSNHYEHQQQITTESGGSEGIAAIASAQSRERVIYRRFPKLTLLIDIDNHMILGMLRSRGPKPDVQEL